jgi:glycosyltransferase involved in cell wall biosynthesis
MTRAERIKIRAERIKERNKRLAAAQKAKDEQDALLASLVSSTVTPPVDGKLTIEICIHCFRYQHRLCWMLSSLLQQKGDIPNLTINISHTNNDGTPTTEEVCKFFREKGLNIKETIVTQEQISNRAIARNKQVSETMASWILFADSDIVYDPYFFDDLQKQLKTNLRDIKLVMGADRFSLNDNFCIKYFSEEDKREYPCVVEDVASISSKFPIKWLTGKYIAPGNFQLANVECIRAKGMLYTGRTNDYWRNTRSDRSFRCRMGGRIPINVKPMYHLNHDRGGPDIQR